MTFRYRLALFLVITLVAVQALTALLAYGYLRDDIIEQGKRELADATTAFTRQLNVLSERATEGVRVLSLDFALRQAIAKHDRGTELSALHNHGERIGASRMMLIGLDGRISADTANPQMEGKPFIFRDLLKEALANDQATKLDVLNGQVCVLVVVPVRAPVPIAFISACVPVDGAFLQKMREISSSSRSIALATMEPTGKWVIAARSQTHPLTMKLPAGAGLINSTTEIVAEDGKNYLTAMARVSTGRHSAPVAVIMDYPLEEALSADRAVVGPILMLLALGLLVTVVGAMLIVRGVSKPLEALAASARKIAGGDYTPPPRIETHDELGQLSDALINMTKSIADREAALNSAIESAELARNEAVRANEAKSQFLANISHELRTPLNAVLGFSEMLMQQVLGPLGVARYADYAHDIHNSGKHLLGLVQRMLDLAESEAGRFTIAHEPVSAGRVLYESVVHLSALAERSEVRLNFLANTAAWPEIVGDANKLKQAFTNILHNAIKFTPAGGAVAISGHVLADRLELRIEDTGIGMQPEDIAIVVRPFHRLRSALDGQHQGAGLGLPFAKTVIERHGGALKIESAPGIGTTVIIDLPLAAGALERAA